MPAKRTKEKRTPNMPVSRATNGTKRGASLSDTLARVISLVFEPMMVLVFIMIMGAYTSGMRGIELARFVGIFLGILLLPSFIFRVWAVKRHLVKNWDVTDRKQRIIPMLVFGVFFAIAYYVDLQYGNLMMIRLFSLSALWFAGFFLVTLYWKMSGHVGVVALAAGLLMRWFGPAAILSMVAVVAVAWSRIHRHDHTRLQTLVAALYSLIIVWYFY